MCNLVVNRTLQSIKWMGWLIQRNLTTKMTRINADITNNKKYDESTKFNLTYKLLNGSRNMRYFKPCFKHYLLNHVKSRFAEVPAPEWEIATFLPTAQWEKSTAGRIYSDSRKAI